ncbi:MAG: MBL fold metallo-hydrolase [Bacilli bacterium]|nr:MBL fold metallo-hydrolase [Bacilli bacterium]
MEIKTIVTGDLEENCYLLVEKGNCLIIDPGDEYSKIRSVIENKNVLGVLITHHHFDHVGALKLLVEEFKVPVYDFSTKEGKYTVGPFMFQMVSNPGHSLDSIRFVFEEPRVMFVGDFIFRGSIGRCDLPGGSTIEMKRSIDRLLQEKKDYTLYPGHGPKTTLEYERNWNPYF